MAIISLILDWGIVDDLMANRSLQICGKVIRDLAIAISFFLCGDLVT